MLCKIDNCTSKARRRGRCKKHFKLWKLDNPIVTFKREPENRKPFAVNSYRYLWEVRMKRKILCEEWKTLTVFAAGVHPMPEPRGEYKLCRPNPKLPFGPDNFSWRKIIVMLPGETKKTYTARMRRETIARNPTFERDRQLMRTFGITPEQYEQMLQEQNGVCAICERPEKLRTRVKKVNCLAVDHCHDTGEIRGLLCFDCNVTLGRMGESVERLEAMIRYVKRHKAPQLKVVTNG